MIRATVLDEPELEFGFGARHQEQRAGVMLNGPADIEMPGRKSEIRLGLVGPTAYVSELADWLRATTKGAAGKETKLAELFPSFPGCTPSIGFMVELKVPRDAQRGMSKARLRPIADAPDDVARVDAAVKICAEEVETLHQRASVDVVMVVRPDGVPRGVPEGAATGGDFHDLLKARLITLTQPIQIIRPATWRGGRGIEDYATCAWNLFTALYYKAGGSLGASSVTIRS